MRTWLATTAVMWLVTLGASASLAGTGSIQGTPHDLSAVEGGASCSFCHTPHGAMAGTPLWSHTLSTAVYKIYESSSLKAKVGQPTGSSKLCLSCHDGTVALSETISGSTGGAYMSAGSANLGTDLSDDHPISFVYSSGLSAENAQIRSPIGLPEPLKLDRSGELQCTTCHDAHDNHNGKFLVMSNERSQMCVSCHDLKGWTVSVHESSGVLVAGASDPYLQEGNRGTLAEAGCLACHRPHGAGGHQRLLHFAQIEENCLNCHDGLVAGTNIKADMLKLSRHNVFQYRDVHDPREIATTAPMHVECVDCHNPHAVQHALAPAPIIPGVLQGVSGITVTGSMTANAQFEYEVCFKCHADNPERPTSSITRQITQTNTRLEFEPSAPSFHPVIAPGANPNVPSLIPPMTVATLIYCTDCHNSDSTSSAKGPHGSVYRPLLAARYETADFTKENSSSYELCYRCHSRNSILAGQSFPGHSEHLEEGIPCSACHDAHGIAASQGSKTNNSHLINFDVAIVRPDPVTGRQEFDALSPFHGQCYLSCHGKNHSPKEY
jgi:predicted CXXCH cytochrome family protein